MDIKLAVDRSRNCVLFADVGSDFVNVILSFLTLPLSTVQFCAQGGPPPPPWVSIIPELLPVGDDKEDEPPNELLNVQIGCLSNLCKRVGDDKEDELLNVQIGCLSNLCNSVSRLQESKLLKVVACHGMLLMPCHSHEFKYCERECMSLTRFLKTRGRYGSYCRCWLVMARLVHAYKESTCSNVFVRGKERFVISDDWTIKPASTSTMQSIPRALVSDEMDHDFEEVQVCLTWKEVQVMFKASLLHRIPYSPICFYPRKIMTRLLPSLSNQASIPQEPLHHSTEDTGSLPEICKIKLFFDRQEKKVMYAECKHEFVDLILGFLTYPLGCLIKNMGASHLSRGLDNLYSSAADLDPAGLMAGKYPREALVDPSLAPFNMGSYISEGAVQENKELYMCMVPYSCCGNASAADKACPDCHGDLVEDRKYVVSDDLQVHQASAMRVTKYWCRKDKANVVEMDISVGRQAAVALLRAVLTSETALTDVFIGRLEEPPVATSL